MNAESIREYCLTLRHTTEELPFDDTTVVFKVKGKMFLFLSTTRQPLWVNVKCDPDLAIDLRDRYPEVFPGYHCNKKHWNTIEVSPRLRETEIKTWIDHSYNLVVSKLPKREKENW